MRKIISFILNTIFSIFKIDDKKIVFESGRGLIDGNAKSIYKYMKKNSPEYRLIWLVTKDTNVEELDKEDYVYYKTLKSYYHLATSKYWIKNQSIGSLLKKKKNQVYIQVFHGNGVLKKMGYDVNNDEDRPELDHVKEWDYYIANDEQEKNSIISSTGYKGKFEVLGMSCIDNVINDFNNQKEQEKIKKELNIIDKSKKIILYAPTFRDFDLDKDTVNVPIKKLSKLKDYYIIVRLHPLVRDKVNVRLFENKNMVNGCNISDCSKLLAISDILITDYSSIFYEYLPLKLPIIFYPYDYDKYVNLRGGFYVDYKKELPGPICYNEEELYNTIINIDNIKDKYNNKREKFNKKYNNMADGKATERFVDKLVSGYFK